MSEYLTWALLFKNCLTPPSDVCVQAVPEVEPTFSFHLDMRLGGILQHHKKGNMQVICDADMKVEKLEDNK